MALDLYSESSSLNTSPRLSFSHNLHQNDTTTTTTSQIENHPNRLDSSLLLDSNPDFDFCITNDNIQPIDPNSDFDFRITNDNIQPIEPNSDFDFRITNTTIQSTDADELFSRGQIRPLKLQERFIHLNPNSHHLPPLPTTLSKNGIFNQETSPSKEIIIPDQNQPNSSSISNSKSFWGIKRSSSVHVDENTYKKSSFWSNLPLLSRSNSTGSVPSPKQTSQRQPKNSGAAGSSFYMYTLSQKPPLKRNYGGGGGGGYGNGVRINPVLNVPPHFITKGSASLFGLGSLFGNGKDKKNKK